jgi:hypothetical protein
MASEYFPHDFHARDDLRDIRMRFGMEGYGFYWGFVEILHESGGYIKECDLAAIAYDLKVSEALCNAVVKESGFFVVKKGKVTSDRVLRNLKKRMQISEARKAAAETRWKNDGEGEKTPSESGAPLPSPIPDRELERLSGEAREAVREHHAWFYEKSVEERIPWFEERLSTFEAEDADGDDSDIWKVRPLFFNLMDELKHMKFVTVNRRKIHTADYLNTVTYFFFTRSGIDDFCQVVRDVDELVRVGRVKNKQNYLISALYNAAKMNGGGQ